MEPIIGNVQKDGSRLVVELDAKGQAIVGLPTRPLRAGHYRFFVVNTVGQSEIDSVALVWWTSSVHALAPVPLQSKLDGPHQAPLRLNGWAGSWVDLDKSDAWADQVVRTAIAFSGAPSTQVTIRDANLLSHRPIALVAAAAIGWASYTPWQQWSINHYSGAAPEFIGGYRTPIVVGLLALICAGYALALLALSPRLRFDWRIAGAFLLVGWLALDAPWQWSLFRQLVDTKGAFSDKSPRQKALSGEDALVFELVEAVRPLLGSPANRVFIASPHEYLALRTAYRLLPHNAFWARGRSVELPHAEQLGQGDFVLVLLSEHVDYDSVEKRLRWAEHESLPAELLFTDRLGRLYRVL
jgi:hypothetical protein